MICLISFIHLLLNDFILKMKKLLFLPFLMAAGFAQAQISLTQSDFASVGDTVFLATDISITGTNVGTASASAQTWNFTSFGIDGFDTLLFVNPAAAPGGNAAYPTANVALITGQTATFFNKTAASVQVLGNGGAAGGFGFSAPFNPPYNILNFPTTQGSSITATTGFDVTEYIGIDTTVNFPPFVSNLHVQVDSIRFNRASDIAVTFDAHGTVNLPVGTFQALRAYNEQTNNDTVYAFMGGPVDIAVLNIHLVAGWNVITAEMAANLSLLAPNLFGGQTTGITTSRSYDWYANGVGYRMVSIELDTAAGHAPKRVQYLSDPVFLSITNAELLPAAFVYPNPTAEFVTMSGINSDMKGEITIVDMTGKVVMNTRYAGQNQISVAGLSSGTYFFRFTDVKGKLVFADKFQVVK